MDYFSQLLLYIMNKKSFSLRLTTQTVFAGRTIQLPKQIRCDTCSNVPCFSCQTRSASPAGLTRPFGPSRTQSSCCKQVLFVLLLTFMYIHVYNTGSFSADTGINTTNHMQTYSRKKEDSKKAPGKCTFLQLKIMSTNTDKVLFFKIKQRFLANLFRLVRLDFKGFD